MTIPDNKMIILDTNVVSEFLRAPPAPKVKTWLAAQDPANIYLTSVSAAELRYGVAIMPGDRKQKLLEEAMESFLCEKLHNPILPFDSVAAKEYSRIFAERRAMGHSISQLDCQVAAIARANAGAVATYNAGSFHGCGIEVINPWHDEGGA